MQITIDIPDAIAQRILPHWSNLAQKLLELLLQAARQAGLISPEEARVAQTSGESETSPDFEILQYMKRQAELYEQQRSELVLQYQGKYIWFENGQVLDADADFARLMGRSYAKTRTDPRFIRLVTLEDPQYRVRGANLRRDSRTPSC